MGALVRILRQPDLVGILTKKIFIVLLPMTEEKNARIAMKRILRKLQKPLIIKGISFTVQYAGVVIFFDHERTLDLESFISTAENEHNELLIRLKNIQNLY